MTQDTKRAKTAVEGDREDRISDLPRNVIDHILVHLPVQDAARTCVLSKSWRYIWIMLPNLVLDNQFCHELIGKSESSFREVVDKILLQHMGDMVKFVLNNVVTLRLEPITFVPTSEYCVIKVPLLAKLILSYCAGVQYLNIVSPGLEYLYVRDCPYYYLMLNCFMNCKNLSCLELTFEEEVYNSSHDESSTVEKFLVSLPALEVLHLCSFFVELLSKGIVRNGLRFMLNCLRHLSLVVDFGKLDQTSYVLQLIKSIPNLSNLQICVERKTGDDDGAVVKYLDTPDCLERPLNKLELVTIDYCDGSDTELLFVKLLLSHSPSLLRMCIELYENISIKGERDLLMEAFPPSLS
ncbi:hypothetical protein K7X08_034543 [Anisodus acutangulus]|uniref:F-box domain-containing protein n=1 Tax=Anisodus acutangulus TaxID=402998 RepID=A0A9Q1LIG2_9SOLA|nr:hypothetical protein K7X08_034543 [Anisodus acutangulus]